MRSVKIKMGSKGELVKIWQALLIKEGFSLKADGIFGPRTHAATIGLQKRLNLPETGIVDEQTWQMNRNELSKKDKETNRIVSDEGRDLILTYEVGGSDGSYYNRFLKRPTVPAWQTTQSGVTIMIGKDLGHSSKENIREEVSPYTSPENLNRLLTVQGMKSRIAFQNLNRVSDIEFSWEDAVSHFERFTIPRFWTLTRNTFTGINSAPQAVKDVMISIVFNRGSKLTGATRVEMLNIRNLISQKNWHLISDEIRKMKRLWPNVRGLLRRRDAEADFLDRNL
jgi:hypothetical protein